MARCRHNRAVERPEHFQPISVFFAYCAARSQSEPSRLRQRDILLALKLMERLCALSSPIPPTPRAHCTRTRQRPTQCRQRPRNTAPSLSPPLAARHPDLPRPICPGVRRHRNTQGPGLSPLGLMKRYGDQTQGHDGDSSVLPRPTAAEMLRGIQQMDRHRSNLDELCQFVEHLTLVPSHDGTTLDCDPTTAPPSSTAEALRLFDLNSRTPVPLDTLGTLVEGFGFGRPNETSQAAPAAPSENSDPSRLLRAIREKRPATGGTLGIPCGEEGRHTAPPRRSRRTIRILRPCSSLFAKQIRNWATSRLRYASERRRAE